MQVSDYELRPGIKIVNVVCTADIKQKVNIESFNKYRFLNSNLDLYRCGYVKDDIMIGKVTVFGNGKLISAGTKSPEQAFEELKRACEILRKYKLVKSYKLEPTIRNIVSNTSLENGTSLNRLTRILPRCIYEPEQFPGLIYNVSGSITALIFNSGKMVIVGAKNVKEINSAFFDIKERIK